MNYVLPGGMHADRMCIPNWSIVRYHSQDKRTVITGTDIAETDIPGTGDPGRV